MTCGIAAAQKPITDKAISGLYQGSALSLDSVNYYLVKFKNPASSDLKKMRLIKRINYNYYIVQSGKSISSDANVLSTVPANSLWKASDNLLSLLGKHPKNTKNITLMVTRCDEQTISAVKKFGVLTTQSPDNITINTSLNKLPQLLQLPFIVFAAETRKAHEDLAISDIDLTANNISAIANNYPTINGTGINVAIKEDKFDDDIDLLGRSFTSFKAAAFTSGHATIMATLIGGNGNSYIKGLGAAPKSKLTSSDFAQLMPDSATIFKAYNISIENHSYGTGIENYYGPEALAYDKQVYETDSLIHIFSSGNIGTTAPEAGLYETIVRFSNLSGTFKQAKNVLVVGGTDRTNQPEDLSSSGPAYDGRIKPEIVADGEDGTSGAAALVTGSVALLQQAYKQVFHHLPSAALIKSVLINSADDIGAPGVDFKTGYGKLNTLEALRTIYENRFNSGVVGNQQQQDFTIAIPPNCSQLKISLAWNDPPANLNAPAALINNLDLSLTTTDGGMLLPWTLSTFPSADSLSLSAQRKKDDLNNTEQVTLQNPASGIYTIHVNGTKIPGKPQAFYIAYQAIKSDGFEWVYPSGNEQLSAADKNYLRWQSSFDNTTGKLSVSYDGGATWQAIDNIVLQNNYCTWTPPGVFASALLKMEINGRAYITPPFSISKPPILNVGYKCTDGILLHWNATPGSIGYNIYNIKDNLLTKINTATDTSVIIPTQQLSTNYFAVCAQGNGFEGIKSYTIDAANQGVGCYVKTLLVTPVNNTAVLNLELGSVLNLSTITWEKLTNHQYTAFGITKIGNALSYNFTDTSPQKGAQYYRAKLTTTDSQSIYTNPASAIFLQASQFIVYPNPAGSEVNVLSGDSNQYQFKLYDASGRLSMHADINQLQNTFQLFVSPGFYIYVILLDGKVIDQGKLIKI